MTGQSSPATDMADAAKPAAADRGTFRLYRHVVIGLAIALIAPFTALAWPFAILVGIVIGQDDVDRRRGVPRSVATRISRVLAITGGVLAMLFAGAIFGGLIALLVVALAALSERAAADAEPIDTAVARILLFVLPIVVLFALVAVGAQVNIRIGG